MMMTPISRRDYAADLRRHAEAYALAATAPGLRKDAARYLAGESERLHGEARANERRAEEEEHR